MARSRRRRLGRVGRGMQRSAHFAARVAAVDSSRTGQPAATTRRARRAGGGASWGHTPPAPRREGGASGRAVEGGDGARGRAGGEGLGGGDEVGDAVVEGDVGAAEAVDGLLRVADEEELAGLEGEVDPGAAVGSAWAVCGRAWAVCGNVS